MQKILILDFGGPYTQLTARKVRQCHVYCEIHPYYAMTVEEVRSFNPIGIILSGRPKDLQDPHAPHLPEDFYHMGIPILSICYACQLMVRQLGGTVTSTETGDPHFRTLTTLDTDHVLFSHLTSDAITWMCSGDSITSLPQGFHVTATTSQGAIAGVCCPEKKLYGVRFHPETNLTKGGDQMIRQFLYQVCDAQGTWTMEQYTADMVQHLRQKVGSKRVLLALSGGVDSSVATSLLARAIGPQLTCIFVDHGMLREQEGDQVEAIFSKKDIHFVRVNAAAAFQARLNGVTHPGEKRRIINEEFVRVLKDEAKKLGSVEFFAQGTIYPDIIDTGYTDLIRSTHKNGILPEQFGSAELLEPLRYLFKEEVRELGRSMGLPETLINRQPFPGPGLAIRTIGAVTPEKIEILRKADAIFTTALETARMHEQITQYFAVLTENLTIDINGPDEEPRYTLALRAVNTDDFMTAKWTRLPYELLDSISHNIIQQVPQINRVVYDVTSKPPATIEWE